VASPASSRSIHGSGRKPTVCGACVTPCVTALPEPERQRDDPPPLRRGGRALRRSAAGNVRLRPLGPRAGAPLPGARPARYQAAVRHLHPRRDPFRLRDQGEPRRRRPGPRDERGDPPRVPGDAFRLGRGDLLPRRAEDSPGAGALLVRGGRAPGQGATGLCRRPAGTDAPRRVSTRRRPACANGSPPRSRATS
jgi:hypothetical protein